MTPQPITIACIGTGNRFYRYYADLFSDFSSRGACSIAGVWTRTTAHADEAVKRLSCYQYLSLRDVLNDKSVSAVFNLTRGSVRHEITRDAIRMGKHVFAESPAGSTSAAVRRLAALADQYRVRVQIAEDSAFLPEALVHRDAITSGVLGAVLQVCNDDAHYAHHGIARLQVLMGGIRDVRSYWWRHVDGRLPMGLFGFRWGDGVTYIERFPSDKNHETRRFSQWKIVCERGVLSQTFMPESGIDSTAPPIDINVAGRMFTWRPEQGRSTWSRKHHALHYLTSDFLDSVACDRLPVYAIQRADVAIQISRIRRGLARLPFPCAAPGWVGAMERYI